MQIGVSIDEAWGGMETQYVPERPVLQAPAPPNAEPPSHAAHAGGSVSKREKVEAKLVSAITSLTTEVTELRSKLAAQNESFTTFMYASIAIGLVLLVCILQSFFKLNHAAECMLWASHR